MKKSLVGRTIIAALINVAILISLPIIPVCANANLYISKGDEIDLPEGLNFSINKTCSDHLYFLQAAAREDGAYIIYSRHHTLNEISEDNFKKAYIDIYDENGIFIEELSFYTPYEFTVEITAESVNLYFYSWVLVYNLETKQIKNYEIVPGIISEADLQDLMKQNEFYAGEWKYKCKRGFDGYVRLTRTNANHEQILIETAGTGLDFAKNIIVGSFSGLALCLVIGFFYLKFSNRKKE